MKVRHLLLLLSRHRITVTLSGVLFVTIISSLVFVQSVFGQNPFVQMYETIQPLTAAASHDTAIVTAKPSSDDPELSDTIKEITPPETLAALILETEAPITEVPVTETPTAVPETTAAATTESTEPVMMAQPPEPASAAVTPAETKAQIQPIQETTPAAAAQAAAETQPATPAPEEATPAGTFDSAMAYAVLDAVNKVRSDNALPAVVWNDSLASSAQIRARELVVCFDHNRPDGSEWWTAGDQLQMAENLGKEQSSAEGVVGDWMASSSHAANILNASYTSMGVACYYCGGTYYWAQEFY